jgi:hypothetical protein
MGNQYIPFRIGDVQKSVLSRAGLQHGLYGFILVENAAHHTWVVDAGIGSYIKQVCKGFIANPLIDLIFGIYIITEIKSFNFKKRIPPLTRSRIRIIKKYRVNSVIMIGRILAGYKHRVFFK